MAHCVAITGYKVMDGSLCSYYRVQGNGCLSVVITGYKVTDGSL